LKRVYADSGKSPTLTSCGGGNTHPKVLCGAWRGRYIKDGKRQDHKGSVAGKTEQRLEIRQDGKTNTLTTVQKDNVAVLIVNEATKKGYTEIEDGDTVRAGQPQAYPRDYKKLGLKRVERMEFRDDEKSNTVIADSRKNQIETPPTYRKLTPLECERLQTVDDYYTDGVSNTQRFKMLGNSFTVDVICHVLKNIRAEFARMVA
jgi:site-specific DNA-cytosine methylase